jgi:hypothetical protein
MDPMDDMFEHDAATDAATLELRAAATRATTLSGLYRWTNRDGGAQPGGETAPAPSTDELPGGPTPAQAFNVEELRLDVDGPYPQRTASGTFRRLGGAAHWVASLRRTSTRRWSGSIWFKDGTTSWIPYTAVSISVTAAATPELATVRFSGGGAALTRALTFVSPSFRAVDFEYDFASDTQALTSIQTHAHPNHPATLPNEQLSIAAVYRRAGFDVSESAGGTVPKALAGANGQWSDNEMHDAMQAFWSHFANAPQWAMWVFFASLHETGTSLGGVMFDDIGPNHRQGTAIFNDAFISQPPTGDAAPAAWVARMRFWTAVHEMGHAFNLAHAWQKSLGTSWIPISDNTEARSFMNYPFRVTGGQTAFFANFDYRFIDAELLFMRHAPERFVQMGNADWFDHHGFEDANVLAEPTFALELRSDRGHEFEFLEPVVLELKLTNVSGQPQIVDEHVLANTDDMVVIIKKRGRVARQYHGFAQRCWLGKGKVLEASTSMSETLFVSAGANGWDLAEPGYYTLQVALRRGSEDIVSAPFTLRMAPPRSYDEEYVAQDFFGDDVGRVLEFDGTRVLAKANDVLREVVDRFSDRQVSTHARIALAGSLATAYKVLVVPGGAAEPSAALASAASQKATVRSAPADEQEVRQLLAPVMQARSRAAVETLNSLDYQYYTQKFAHCLRGAGGASGGRSRGASARASAGATAKRAARATVSARSAAPRTAKRRAPKK